MTRLPRVLVTGFGPFEDVLENASGRMAERLDGVVVARHGIVGRVLPTAFGAARTMIAAAVAELDPVAIVALGVSRDESARLECFARGEVVSARADVHGETWLGRRLGDDLRVGVDHARWLVALQSIDVRVRASEDAGGYVCNAVFHALLDSAGARPAVFMHVPRASDAEAIEHGMRLACALVSAMIAA